MDITAADGGSGWRNNLPGRHWSQMCRQFSCDQSGVPSDGLRADGALMYVAA